MAQTATVTPRDTKETILDSAEKLFADFGFDGTSMRAVTSEATVNLGLKVYEKLKIGVDNATKVDTGGFGEVMHISLDCGTLGKVLTAVVQANQTDCKKKKGKGKGKGKGKKGGKGG